MIAQAPAAGTPAIGLLELLQWAGILLAMAAAVVAILLARGARAKAERATRRAREAVEQSWRLENVSGELSQQRQGADALSERVAALERGASSPSSPLVAEEPLQPLVVPGFEPAGDDVAPLPPTPLETGEALVQEPATPVEFDGRALRVSRALSALGRLTRTADGRWLLFLNADVEVNHVTHAEWSKIFELRGGGAYSRYRTVTPAAVDWNASAGEGTLTERGVAEAIA